MADVDPKANIEELLSTASDLPEGRTDYANIVHVNVSGNDVVVDFYLITPTKPTHHDVQVQHVQRIILPIQVARDAGAILVNAADEWAKTFGVKLPFTPAKTDNETAE